MSDFIAAWPVISGLFEKGGIIGVMLIVCFVLGKEVLRYRAENARLYVTLGKERMISSRYKTMLDINKIQVDISDIMIMFNNDKEEK